MYDDYNNCSVDFRKFLDKNLSKYDNMIYDIYCADILDKKYEYLHVQGWGINETVNNTCYKMPDEYAHDTKKLHIFKKPLRKIKIVGQAKFYYDNKKYNITTR